MKKYFLFDGATQLGPFSLEELRTRNLTPQTSIWFEPMPDWKPAGEIDELKFILDPNQDNLQSNLHSGVAAKEEDWHTKQFYFTDRSGQQGPFKLTDLVGKTITPETPIWYDPLPEWTTFGKVHGLLDLINHIAATPQQAMASAEVPKQVDLYNTLYYFTDTFGQQGPFKITELMGKSITPDTPIWYEPLPEWTTAGKILGLMELLNKPGNVSQMVLSSNNENTSGMKVRFAIRKGKEKLKTGVLSSKEIDNYELTATFTPSEKEKKIYNDHPLFKEVVFMQYNEIDKFATGFLLLGKEETVDRTKRISVGSIYSSPTYTFRAHSVERIVELRELVIEAGENFAKYVKVLEGLEGVDEIEFQPKE